MKKIFIFLFLFICSIAAFAQNKISDTFLEGAIITSFQFDDKDIWVSTYGHGIFHYIAEENQWENFSSQKGNVEQDFFYCIAVSKNYVWAGTGEGLFTYDVKHNSWHKRKFGVGGELGNWIRSLYYDPSQNTLWIGRFINLTRLEVAKQKYTDFDLTNKGEPKANNYKTIKPDGDSLIWFGTEAGTYKYYKSKRLESSNSYVFYSNKGSAFKGEGETVSLSDFVFDPGAIWFGTDEFITEKKPDFNVGGIFKYNRKSKWEKIDIGSGLTANGIYCLERTGRKLWAGLYSFDVKEKKDDAKGLALIDRVTNNVTIINIDELGVKSKKITCMQFDGEYLWFGTDNGLSRLKLSNPFAEWTLQKKQVKTKTRKTKTGRL